MVDYTRSIWRVSIRRACRALPVERSTYHYRSRRAGQAQLTERIKEIAATRVRYGYRRELRNPYPDRAGCDEEWADAIAYCKGLLERNQLGRGDYRGSGKSLYQCIMGQVSERCGGNSTGA